MVVCLCFAWTAAQCINVECCTLWQLTGLCDSSGCCTHWRAACCERACCMPRMHMLQIVRAGLNAFVYTSKAYRQPTDGMALHSRKYVSQHQAVACRSFQECIAANIRFLASGSNPLMFCSEASPAGHAMLAASLCQDQAVQDPYAIALSGGGAYVQARTYA